MNPSATTSPETIATLLLCGRFGQSRDGLNVLSPSKYNHLAQWLKNHNLTFSDLLKSDANVILRDYCDDLENVKHLQSLLGRTDELDASLKRWVEMGIWVLGRNDGSYPQRLRQRLKLAALPLLFGAGPRTYLNGGGVCVIGSRDSSSQGLNFAKQIGTRCGTERMTVISSDMRGVDRDALSATNDAGGKVICVLSDSLEKALVGRRHRAAFSTGNFVMVTPFSPETRFKIANAIRANKYQYALSDVAVIVETRQTGGVWLGADENRKENWIPAFVNAGAPMAAGNMALLHLGLQPITLKDIESAENLNDYFIERGLQAKVLPNSQSKVVTGGTTNSSAPSDLYQIFVAELRVRAAGLAITAPLIASMFEIEIEQAAVWLARAVADRYVLSNESSGAYFVP